MSSAVTHLDITTLLSSVAEVVRGPDVLVGVAGALAGVALFGVVAVLVALWRRLRPSAPPSVRSTVMTIPPYPVGAALPPTFPPPRVPARILCDETGPASAVTVAALPGREAPGQLV